MFSLSVRPASNSEAARAPPFKILSRKGSYLSLARLPFTVCPSLPRPGLSLDIYILVAGRSWNCGFRPRLPFKSCGSCVVQRGSNNDDVDSAPDFLEIVWFLCGSTWFRQCRSARLAATQETLLGWLWTLAGCWQRPSKRRTRNVLPSTITSAP